jgi:hypothetical protein
MTCSGGVCGPAEDGPFRDKVSGASACAVSRSRAPRRNERSGRCKHLESRDRAQARLPVRAVDVRAARASADLSNSNQHRLRDPVSSTPYPRAIDPRQPATGSAQAPAQPGPADHAQPSQPQRWRARDVLPPRTEQQLLSVTDIRPPARRRVQQLRRCRVHARIGAHRGGTSAQPAGKCSTTPIPRRCAQFASRRPFPSINLGRSGRAQAQLARTPSAKTEV